MATDIHNKDGRCIFPTLDVNMTKNDVSILLGSRYTIRQFLAKLAAFLLNQNKNGPMVHL